VTVKVNFNLKISFIYKKTENASSRMKRRTSDGKKTKKHNTLLKYFRGLGHKSSLIISATCNFGGKPKLVRQ